MFTHSCPRCQKKSYSCDEESFNACPYCGFKFSSRHGPDRRNEERIRQETHFTFSFNKKHYNAYTVDLSSMGLSIRVSGETHFNEGDILSLPLRDHQISTKVIWINKVPDKFMVGLQKLM